MLKREGIRPRLRPALDLPGRDNDYRRVLPFRRSWVAALVLLAFDAVFLVPAITTFQQAARAWSGINGLFDLVGALFLTAWLTGWSIAPLALSTILLLLLFGREVLMLRGDRLVVLVGVPGVGLEMEYAVSAMRNLRFEQPLKKSPKSWRGNHLVFDYGANAVALGSNLDQSDQAETEAAIRAASGRSVRKGEATESELAGEWEATEPLAAAEPMRQEALAGEIPAVTLASPSTLALILANLVPLGGAALLGWDLGVVMVLYWAESAVIGFFNICKIIVIGRWGALLAAPFFAGHFGGFMAVHFLFLWGFFVKGPQDFSGGDLSEVLEMFRFLWPALAVLFASHALSFFTNFLGRKEYRSRTIQTQMSEPYKRIIFMHMVLIFGGGLTLVLGESTPVLMLAIAVKIWVDVREHLKQREPVK
ncbi:MAG: DUF6498-containing protein [Lysobacterales bacterium]|jgi:hypothetical protein